MNSIPSIRPPSDLRIALLGGTHTNDAIFDFAPIQGKFEIETEEGASPLIYWGLIDEIPFAYVHFHGEGKWLATWLAFRELGIQEVITGATAGGVNPAMKLFDVVIPHDFADFAVDRQLHVPQKYLSDYVFPRMNPAMDSRLRTILLEESRAVIRPDREYDDVNIHSQGNIWQSRAGRFESVSEISFMRQQGADLVTHNVSTEIIYARQLGIHLASLNVVSNPAEGVADWSFEDVSRVYPRMNPLCVKILMRAVKRISAIDPSEPRTLDGALVHPKFSYKE